MILLLAAWITLAPLIVPRQELAVAAANGRVYAIGGLTGPLATASVETYDPVMNAWRLVAPMPEAIHHAAAVSIDNTVYVIGGYAGSSCTPIPRAYRYDGALDAWTRIADLPSPRGALAAVTIEGQIYAVGGWPTLTDLVVYDPATDRWTARAPMPTPREHLAAAAFGGELFVAGGRAGGNSNAFERYDPSTNQWTSLPSLPTARSGIAAATLGNRIYIFGGEGNPDTTSGVFEEVDSYDVARRTWQREPSMPTPRHGIGAATVGGRILIAGGATIAGYGVTAVHEALEVVIAKRRAVRR